MESHNVRVKPPKRLRKEVWEYRFQHKYIGKCAVTWCNNKLEALGSWHVGHNVAYAKGGSYELHNLYPLCDQCNLSMSTQTIDSFNELVRKRSWFNCCRS